jgi:hypothetical protein
MRVTVGLGILGVLVLTHALCASGQSQATLTGLRYGVRGTESTLRVLFRGEPGYALVPDADGVGLVFTGARVGSPPGAAKLAFTSGGIRGVAVKPLRGDSARLTITLRGRPSYALARTSEGFQLTVTESSGPKGPLAPRLGQVQPRTDPRVIDIPALAFSEARGEHAAAMRQAPGASSPREHTPAAGVAAVPLAVAAGLSAFGTTALLLMLGLRLRLLPVTGDSTPPAQDDDDAERPEAQEDAPGDPTARERMNASRYDDGRTDGPFRAGEAAPADDPALQDEPPVVAGSYEALRLHDTAWSSSIAHRVREISASGRSNAGMLREARKYGIGTGELELASSLQRCERRTRRKEGEQ